MRAAMTAISIAIIGAVTAGGISSISSYSSNCTDNCW